jgi:hypothetical protein
MPLYTSLLDIVQNVITPSIMSTIECIKGKFGKDCKDTCPSNCNNDVCNFDNGDCIDRCKPGYQGNKCEESK